MEKIVAFLYNYHKNDPRTSDIALLQTFCNISTFSIFIIVPLFHKIGLGRLLDVFENLSNNNRYLEYLLGTSFILLIYYVFSKIYDPQRLDLAYKKYKYHEKYLIILRIIYIANLVLCLFI